MFIYFCIIDFLSGARWSDYLFQCVFDFRFLLPSTMTGNDQDDWEIAVDTGEFDKRLEQLEKDRVTTQVNRNTCIQILEFITRIVFLEIDCVIK